MRPKLTTDVDSNKIYYWLVLLSIALAVGFFYVLRLFQSLSIWIIFIDFGSVFGFYVLLIHLFDRCLWKWKIWYCLNLLVYPDLSGQWNGTLKSFIAAEDTPKEYKINVEIIQTWLTMSISFYTKESSSINEFAYMYTKNSKIHIVYEYSNNPKPTIKQAKIMHDHYGFVKLELNKNNEQISGEYYNDPSRNRRGSFIISRK